MTVNFMPRVDCAQTSAVSTFLSRSRSYSAYHVITVNILYSILSFFRVNVFKDDAFALNVTLLCENCICKTCGTGNIIKFNFA